MTTLKILYTEINIIGIIILFIMLCNQIRGTEKTIQQKIFNWLIISTMLTLVFDSGMWIVDGVTSNSARQINFLFTTGYFLAEGITPYFWPLYVEFLVNNDVRKLKKTAYICLFPLMIYIASVFYSIKGSTIFIIDSNNFYQRGKYFFMPLGLAGLYFAFSLAKMYKKLKLIADLNERRQIHYLALFVVLPVVTAVFQILYFGMSIIWISVVISLLIVFINVQNRQILTDSLTGLNNRMQFEKYVSALIKDEKSHGNICLIVIDIDKFKKINDTFGHAEGDRALIAVSDILKRACKNKKTFISRYGGDEFLIIYKAKETEQINELVGDIFFNLDTFNCREGSKYSIHLSIGKAIWDKSECNSVRDLFNKADYNMYLEKNRKKINELNK